MCRYDTVINASNMLHLIFGIFSQKYFCQHLLTKKGPVEKNLIVGVNTMKKGREPDSTPVNNLNLLPSSHHIPTLPVQMTCVLVMFALATMQYRIADRPIKFMWYST